jgi:hypothetical protein
MEANISNATDSTSTSVTDPIEELFMYHPPTESQQLKYHSIRETAKDFVRCIQANCPAGPDRTAAIRKVREAVMTANASISTNNAAARPV